jgi:hypothetical protein
VNEEWKVIEGFPNYEVSSEGRVRRGSKILKATPNSHGYLHVSLYREGRGHTKRVHYLVAQAFLPNPNNLPDVNHVGEQTDNRAIMLKRVSDAEHRLDQVLRRQKGLGVHLDRASGKYRASFQINKKRKYLGFFPTQTKALEALNAALLRVNHA